MVEIKNSHDINSQDPLVNKNKPENPEKWIEISSDFTKMNFPELIEFYYMECFGYQIQESFIVPDSLYPYIYRGTIKKFDGDIAKYEFCYAIDIDHYGDDRALKIPHDVYRWIFQTRNQYAKTFFQYTDEMATRLLLISTKHKFFFKSPPIILMYLCQSLTNDFDTAINTHKDQWDELWVKRFFRYYFEALRYRQEYKYSIQKTPGFEPVMLLYPSRFLLMVKSHPYKGIRNIIDEFVYLRIYDDEEFKRLRQEKLDVALMDATAPDFILFAQKVGFMREFIGEFSEAFLENTKEYSPIADIIEKEHLNKTGTQNPSYNSLGLENPEIFNKHYVFYPVEMPDERTQKLLKWQKSRFHKSNHIAGQSIFISKEYFQKERRIIANEEMMIPLGKIPSTWDEFIDEAFIIDFRNYPMVMPLTNFDLDKAENEFGNLLNKLVPLEFNSYNGITLNEFGTFYKDKYGITLDIESAYCDNVIIYSFMKAHGKKIRKHFVVIKDKTDGLRFSLNNLMMFIFVQCDHEEIAEYVEYFEIDHQHLINKYDSKSIAKCLEWSLLMPMHNRDIMLTLINLQKAGLDVDLIFFDALNSLHFNKEFHENEMVKTSLLDSWYYDYEKEKYCDMNSLAINEDRVDEKSLYPENFNELPSYASDLLLHKFEREHPKEYEKYIELTSEINDRFQDSSQEIDIDENDSFEDEFDNEFLDEFKEDSDFSEDTGNEETYGVNAISKYSVFTTQANTPTQSSSADPYDKLHFRFLYDHKNFNNLYTLILNKTMYSKLQLPFDEFLGRIPALGANNQEKFEELSNTIQSLMQSKKELSIGQIINSVKINNIETIDCLSQELNMDAKCEFLQGIHSVIPGELFYVTYNVGDSFYSINNSLQTLYYKSINEINILKRSGIDNYQYQIFPIDAKFMKILKIDPLPYLTEPNIELDFHKMNHLSNSTTITRNIIYEIHKKRHPVHKDIIISDPNDEKYSNGKLAELRRNISAKIRDKCKIKNQDINNNLRTNCCFKYYNDAFNEILKELHNSDFQTYENILKTIKSPPKDAKKLIKYDYENRNNFISFIYRCFRVYFSTDVNLMKMIRTFSLKESKNEDGKIIQKNLELFRKYYDTLKILIEHGLFDPSISKPAGITLNEREFLKKSDFSFYLSDKNEYATGSHSDKEEIVERLIFVYAKLNEKPDFILSSNEIELKNEFWWDSTSSKKKTDADMYKSILKIGSYMVYISNYISGNIQNIPKINLPAQDNPLGHFLLMLEIQFLINKFHSQTAKAERKSTRYISEKFSEIFQDILFKSDNEDIKEIKLMKVQAILNHIFHSHFIRLMDKQRDVIISAIKVSDDIELANSNKSSPLCAEINSPAIIGGICPMKVHIPENVQKDFEESVEEIKKNLKNYTEFKKALDKLCKYGYTNESIKNKEDLIDQLFKFSLERIKKIYLFNYMQNCGVISRCAYMNSHLSKKNETKNKATKNIINNGRKVYEETLKGFEIFKKRDNFILNELRNTKNQSAYTDLDISDFITGGKLSYSSFIHSYFKLSEEARKSLWMKYIEFVNRVRSLRNRFDEYSVNRTNKDEKPELKTEFDLGKKFNRKLFRKVRAKQFYLIKEQIKQFHESNSDEEQDPNSDESQESGQNADNLQTNDNEENVSEKVQELKLTKVLYQLYKKDFLPILFFPDYLDNFKEQFLPNELVLLKKISNIITSVEETTEDGSQDNPENLNGKANQFNTDQFFFEIYNPLTYENDDLGINSIKIVKLLSLFYFKKHIEKLEKSLKKVTKDSKKDKYQDFYLQKLTKTLQIISLCDSDINNKLDNSYHGKNLEIDGFLNYLDKIPVLLPSFKFMEEISKPLSYRINTKNGFIKKHFKKSDYSSYKEVIVDALKYRIAIETTSSLDKFKADKKIGETFSKFFDKILELKENHSEKLIDIEQIKLDEINIDEYVPEDLFFLLDREIFNASDEIELKLTPKEKKKFLPLVQEVRTCAIGNNAPVVTISKDLKQKMNEIESENIDKDEKSKKRKNLTIDFNLKNRLKEPFNGNQTKKTKTDDEVKKLLEALNDELDKLYKSDYHDIVSIEWNLNTYQIRDKISRTEENITTSNKDSKEQDNGYYTRRIKNSIKKYEKEKMEKTEEINSYLSELKLIRECEKFIFGFEYYFEPEFQLSHSSQLNKIFDQLYNDLNQALLQLVEKEIISLDSINTHIKNLSQLLKITQIVPSKNLSDRQSLRQTGEEIIKPLKNLINLLLHNRQFYLRTLFRKRESLKSLIQSLELEKNRAINKFNEMKKNKAFRNAYQEAIKIVVESKLPKKRKNSIEKWKFNSLKEYFSNKKVKVSILPSENLKQKIEKGAKIHSIRILSPKYPAKTCLANISLNANYDCCNPKPKFFHEVVSENYKDLQTTIKTIKNKFRNEDLYLGLDDNRLNSLFTFAFSVLKQKELENFKNLIEKENLSKREEKKLISLQNSIYHSINDYITVSSKKRGSISISINKIKTLICACAGIGNTKDNRYEDKFFEKLTKYILSDIHIPSGDEPDNMYASEYKPQFSDYLMSPIKYWETKRTHLRKHIIGLQRLNKAAMKERTTQQLDLSKPEDRLIFRRKNEKYLLWKRYNNLRMSMRNYLLRSFALVVNLFEPAHIGHEKLNFSQNSMSGFLKLIVDSMFDNLDEFTEIIAHWTRTKKYTPKFVPVNAQNTSKYLFTLKILKNIPSKFSIIDRSMSYDYSYIKLAPEIFKENDSASGNSDEEIEKIKILIKGKIIEAHFEAAATIAWRAFIKVINPSIISLILYNKYGEG